MFFILTKYSRYVFEKSVNHPTRLQVVQGEGANFPKKMNCLIVDGGRYTNLERNFELRIDHAQVVREIEKTFQLHFSVKLFYQGTVDGKRTGFHKLLEKSHPNGPGYSIQNFNKKILKGKSCFGNKNITEISVEQGVDAAIGTKIIECAYGLDGTDPFDKIVVITGDADLLRAIECADKKKPGIINVLADRDSISNRLLSYVKKDSESNAGIYLEDLFQRCTISDRGNQAANSYNQYAGGNSGNHYGHYYEHNYEHKTNFGNSHHFSNSGDGNNMHINSHNYEEKLGLNNTHAVNNNAHQFNNSRSDNTKMMNSYNNPYNQYHQQQYNVQQPINTKPKRPQQQTERQKASQLTRMAPKMKDRGQAVAFEKNPFIQELKDEVKLMYCTECNVTALHATVHCKSVCTAPAHILCKSKKHHISYCYKFLVVNNITNREEWLEFFKEVN